MVAISLRLRRPWRIGSSFHASCLTLPDVHLPPLAPSKLHHHLSSSRSRLSAPRRPEARQFDRMFHPTSLPSCTTTLVRLDLHDLKQSRVCSVAGVRGVEKLFDGLPNGDATLIRHEGFFFLFFGPPSSTGLRSRYYVRSRPVFQAVAFDPNG